MKAFWIAIIATGMLSMGGYAFGADATVMPSKTIVSQDKTNQNDNNANKVSAQKMCKGGDCAKKAAVKKECKGGDCAKKAAVKKECKGGNCAKKAAAKQSETVNKN